MSVWAGTGDRGDRRRLCGYVLEKLIAQGPSGPVYLARLDGGSGGGEEAGEEPGDVVLKVLACCGDASLRAEIEALVDATRGLRHPNVVEIYGALAAEPDVMCAEPDVMCIVSALAPGGSLFGGARPVPSPGRAVEWLAAIADALDRAHGLGLVHSNVHPGNVVMSATDEPMLTDFGLARLMARRGWAGPPAPYGDAAVHREPSWASDVYALGVLGIELLAAARHLAGASRRSLTRAAKERAGRAHLRQVAPDLPEGLCDVMAAATCRDPLERPSAAEFRDVLSRMATWPDTPTHDRGLLEHSTARVLLPRSNYSAALQARRARRRVAVGWSLGALLALLAGGLAWLSATPGGGPPRAGGPTCRLETAAIRPGGAHSIGRALGRSCGQTVAWRSGVATVATRGGHVLGRFVLGHADDELLIGNWYCRADEQPALYSPQTGQVSFFAGWARSARPLRSASPLSTGLRRGTAAVDSAGARCRDRVDVRVVPGP